MHEVAWVRVDITDTGKRMSVKMGKRVFEPFFTTKPIGLGTGLGLSLLFAIIKKHQVRIEVDSTPGERTTLHLWVPVGRALGAATDDANNTIGKFS